MKHSEFWKAVDTVYGSAYGSSLAQDLVVPGLRATCAEALDAGVPPREVWHALCDDAGQRCRPLGFSRGRSTACVSAIIDTPCVRMGFEHMFVYSAPQTTFARLVFTRPDNAR